MDQYARLPKMGFTSLSTVPCFTVLLVLLLSCTHCAKADTSNDSKNTHVSHHEHQTGLQYSRDFGVFSFTFSGEWGDRPYQATVHTRAVCRDSNKHMRMLISIAPAPHPYYKYQRAYEFPVTPVGWFSYGENGMPKIWFQDFATGERVAVMQHVGEREVDGSWFFDDEWVTVCWLGTANLKPDTAYTLNIEGSERSYQAVPPGPCPTVHPMFEQQLHHVHCRGNTPNTSLSTDGGSATHSSDARATNCQPAADPSTVMLWMAPVQKVTFAKPHMAYIMRQHLEYHLQLGMAGMLLPCDYFVCLQLLHDPYLASRVREGRLVLWVWEHGNEFDKPHAKLYHAANLMRMAAYGTPAMLAFQDLDEFMVLPSGQSIQQLLAPGGCLAGVRQYSQAAIRSKVTVATNWSNAELPAWLSHELWVDALAALNYRMAPQGFYGWKSIVDPNSDYNFLCHDHHERDGMMGDGQWTNYVDDSCAYNMHFTNWFSDRIWQNTVGGVVGDFVPLAQSKLAALRAVYSSSSTTASGLTWTAGRRCGAGDLSCSSGELQRTNASSSLQHVPRDPLPVLAVSNPPIKHAVKTVSVTLVSRSADILIGRALKSVSPLVDACLVVYSSALHSPEKTLAAAVEAVGDKLVTHEVPSGAFEVMLNSSLAVAKQLGAQWAILLGADQELLADSGLQQAVADAMSSGVTQHNCFHRHLEFSQAFLVRLSAGGGFVHDQYVQPHGHKEATLRNCTVTRPTKAEPWKKRRAKEAIAAVREGHAAKEMPQAAWFVLAEALWVLGKRHEAQTAWQQCTVLQQSRELGALCAYRQAALAHVPITAHSQAVDTLQTALDLHGHSPELCWLAAYTAYYAGQYERAKELALQAVRVGCYKGICMSEGRIPVNVGARYGFPYDVSRFALAELGDAQGAELAEQEMHLAHLASSNPAQMSVV